MSDAEPTDAEPADAQPAPGPEELARRAEPATVRRAPRYRAFVLAGLVVGLLVAVVLVLARVDPDRAGAGPAAAIAALGLATCGALAGAVAAVLADRRSRR